jgi:plastocyanin
MNRAVWSAGACAVAAAITIAACGGGGSGSPTTPTNPGGGGGGGGTPSTTITITAAGVSPQAITVPAGSRVTFVNQDVRPHEMNSDPHPTHGDCPEIDQVGFLAVGQSKQTGNLVSVRNCGYHDHQQPFVASLQGTIRIQ